MDDIYGGTGAVALLAAVGLFATIFGLAGYLISSFFLMKVFDKAGVQGKWRAWVPVYNGMIFLKLGDLSPWLLLIGVAATAVLGWVPFIGGLVAFAAAALMVVAAWRVGLKLQKDAVWVVLYFFLSLVWLGINAFDRSRWNPQIAPAPWAAQSFFADRTVWQGIPVQPSAAAPGPGYAAPGGAYAPPAGAYPPAGGYPPPAPGAAPTTPPGPVAPGATPPVPPADSDPRTPPA